MNKIVDLLGSNKFSFFFYRRANQELQNWIKKPMERRALEEVATKWIGIL